MKHYIVAYKSLAYCLNEDQLSDFKKMIQNGESDYYINEALEEYEVSLCKEVECDPGEVVVNAYGYDIPRDKFELFLDCYKMRANLQQFEQYKV